MTAVPLSRSQTYRASMLRPSASYAGQSIHSPPRAFRITSAVPSPPSAMGKIRMIALGKRSRSPVAMWSATSPALSEPLNLSGAIKMRIRTIVAQASCLWGERASRPFPRCNRQARRPLAPQARCLCYGLSFRSKISPTNAGFALPFDSFMTCPFRKFSEAAWPALKSVTGLGFAAITSSEMRGRSPSDAK